MFRSVETLTQKAGVPPEQLRRLTLKELCDNALDAVDALGKGGQVRVGALDVHGDSFFVEDDGPGIDPDLVGRLFSINRPLLTSKLWRLPTRGAMGNGLRVVAGAVLASNGSLRVWTWNKRLILRPQDDGSTAVETFDADFPVGTRIEITFGLAIPRDADALAWAEAAVRMAVGETYRGKSSPFWYDARAFWELLQAAGERLVRDLIAELDGCSGANVGKITAALKKGTACNALSRNQATELLSAARAEARPVSLKRLGGVGPLALPWAYACERRMFTVGEREPATIPSVVESWVHLNGEADDRINVFVNRTPITGEVIAYREKGRLALWGCGLEHEFPLPKGGVDIVVNILTPYCPITTDGKEPNLRPFVGAIASIVQSAAKRARRDRPKTFDGERVTQKDVVLENLEEAIAKASGDGAYRFNQRQLFYVVRPLVMEALGKELTYDNFERIITDYESQHGDIEGMYRDPRGTLYHPHIGQDIALGTLAVEDYERPGWTFNKVLYIEKEGAFEALKAARWPERHDCALLTSKGFASRAVKDLLDLLADHDEPVTVFCVHDADLYGTMIFQTLQEETKARGRRRVEIINLGLEPWEAVGMGLEVEPVTRRERNDAVAAYVRERPDGERWTEWLQSSRVELNAMTTPAFLAWLDAKMAQQGGRKVLPPPPVVADKMTERLCHHLRQVISERILREARFEEQVREATCSLSIPPGEDLVDQIPGWLPKNEDRPWWDYVDAIARDLAEGGA